MKSTRCRTAFERPHLHGLLARSRVTTRAPEWPEEAVAEFRASDPAGRCLGACWTRSTLASRTDVWWPRCVSTATLSPRHFPWRLSSFSCPGQRATIRASPSARQQQFNQQSWFSLSGAHGTHVRHLQKLSRRPRGEAWPARYAGNGGFLCSFGGIRLRILT